MTTTFDRSTPGSTGRNIVASQDPVLAVPLPGEALLSVLYRHAVANDYSLAAMVQHLNLHQFLVTRTLGAGDPERIAIFLHTTADRVVAATLEGLPAGVVGTANPRGVVRDPLGWASVHWSNRCRACHDEGAPWEVLQQTSLVWVCERHREFLRATCGACVSPAHMYGRARLYCHHDTLPGQDAAVSAEHVAAQRTIVAKVCGGSPGDVQWLRTLRAACVFEEMALSLSRLARTSTRNGQVQPVPRPDRRVPVGGRAAARLAGNWPTQQQTGVTFEYLMRPHAIPAVIGARIRAVLCRVDEVGSPDVDWAKLVWSSTPLTKTQRERLSPFAAQLGVHRRQARHTSGSRKGTLTGTRTETGPGRRLAPNRPYPGVAAAWVKTLAEFAPRLSEAGFGPEHIPAVLLAADEGIDAPLIPGLARAVLVRICQFRQTTLRAIRDFGGYNSQITTVRDLLAAPPTEQDLTRLRGSLGRLLAEAPCDYAVLRCRQAGLRRVPSVLLNQLNLTPPSSAGVSAEQAAALWLWTVTTGSHAVLAPFADGRRVRPLLGELEKWHRSAPAEQIVALLDWNEHRETEETGIAVPDDEEAARPPDEAGSSGSGIVA